MKKEYQILGIKSTAKKLSPQLLQCAFIVTNTRADFAFEQAQINEISESALYKIVNNSESITLEEKFFTLFESPYFPLHDEINIFAIKEILTAHSLNKVATFSAFFNVLASSTRKIFQLRSRFCLPRKNGSR